MTFVLSRRSRTALVGVHPDLVRVVERALALSTVDFVVLEGVRTVERQRELVAAGASQTLDSRHLRGTDGYGHAVDLGAWLGAVRWDMGLYYPIAAAAQRAARELAIPIRWGGAWCRIDTDTRTPAQMVADYAAQRRRAGRRAFIDAPHFEIPT